MKTKTLFGFTIILFVSLASCSKKEAIDDCPITGTTVNVGSTVGGNFGVTIYQDPSTNKTYDIGFNNTNMNFHVYHYIYSSSASVVGKILDVGPKTCLDFSSASQPVTSYIAYAKGHGYYAVYDDGHIVKFIVNSYSYGSANLTYIFQ